ncbi:hypothetical protein GCM10009665_61990 [Kitasatospora nipponensis]|uniref:DUF397 domain-containing protein n=1 Tax=Kitasatospora nipponensis TaxID=258049 RepID=A0ABP4HFZ9_9ACTN
MDKGTLRTADLSANVWHKSHRSGEAESNLCVEVTPIVIAGAVAGYAMRDSTDPEGPKLYWTVGEYTAYTRAIQDGQQNLLP